MALVHIDILELVSLGMGGGQILVVFARESFLLVQHDHFLRILFVVELLRRRFILSFDP